MHCFCFWHSCTQQQCKGKCCLLNARRPAQPPSPRTLHTPHTFLVTSVTRSVTCHCITCHWKNQIRVFGLLGLKPRSLPFSGSHLLPSTGRANVRLWLTLECQPTPPRWPQMRHLRRRRHGGAAQARRALARCPDFLGGRTDTWVWRGRSAAPLLLVCCPRRKAPGPWLGLDVGIGGLVSPMPYPGQSCRSALERP